MKRRFPYLLLVHCGGAFSLGAVRTARRLKTNKDSSGRSWEDEDPATVLKMLQREMRQRAAASGKPAPPAPPQRSGKTSFFQSLASSGNSAKEESNQPAKVDVSVAAPVSRPAPATNVSAADLIAEAPRSHVCATFHAKSNIETEKPKVEMEMPSVEKEKLGVDFKQPKAKPRTTNPFLQKLSKLEADTQSTSFPTYDAAAEERRRIIDAKIKAERSKMLVFRDVGMDLDKPILSRDVFLVLKYFRYGIEFAVDNELERMLRYFNEHAMNELKIIQDSKLMRGPPTLSRKRRPQTSRSKTGITGWLSGADTDDSAAGVQQSLEFQVSSLFPQVTAANVRQFVDTSSFSAASADLLATLLHTKSSSSSFASFFPPHTETSSWTTGGTVARDYNSKNENLFTPLSASTFRRPAVVIFSQLGQKFGSQADTLWRRLAYATICPGLLPYVPLPDGVDEEPKLGGDTERCTPVSMSIDVVSLRSADVYKFRWVRRLYVRRFAKSLAQGTRRRREPAEQLSTVEMNNSLIASTTFVGSQLLEPFYTTLGLRNYLLPHVMLVDHEGVVRWLSGGCPDSNERLIFSTLLRQLEAEYYKATR